MQSLSAEKKNRATKCMIFQIKQNVIQSLKCNFKRTSRNTVHVNRDAVGRKVGYKQQTFVWQCCSHETSVYKSFASNSRSTKLQQWATNISQFKTQRLHSSSVNISNDRLKFSKVRKFQVDKLMEIDMY